MLIYSGLLMERSIKTVIGIALRCAFVQSAMQQGNDLARATNVYNVLLFMFIYLVLL